MRAVYQHSFPGVREQLGLCHLSGTAAQSPHWHAFYSSATLSQPWRGPTYRTHQLSGSNLLSYHMTKQAWRAESSGPEPDSAHKQTWRLLVLCIPAPSSLSCATYVTNFQGCRYRNNKFQIPVPSTGSNLEGSGVWCGRKRETLVVESGNLGSSPEPSLGPSSLICEIRGWNHMLSKGSLLKAPKSFTNTF